MVLQELGFFLLSFGLASSVNRIVYSVPFHKNDCGLCSHAQELTVKKLSLNS